MKNKYTILLFFSQFLIFSLFLFSLFIKKDTMTLHFITFILLASCLSYYSLYSILKRIRAYALLKSNNDLIIEQQRIQSEHLLALKSQFQDIEEIKKEILNEHIYDQLDDAQEIREYLNKLMKKHIVYKTDYCQNRTVDAIIYNKIPVFEKYHIESTIALVVPNDISIQLYDLISLFTNLIDNAVDGCQTIDDHRYIHITGNIISNYFVLKISNSKSPQTHIDLHSQSSKDSQYTHGYGLQLLNNIAKKYHGSFTIDDHQDNVEMALTLRLKKVDE